VTLLADAISRTAAIKVGGTAWFCNEDRERSFDGSRGPTHPGERALTLLARMKGLDRKLDMLVLEVRRLSSAVQVSEAQRRGN
jgi:hypothetical protein